MPSREHPGGGSRLEVWVRDRGRRVLSSGKSQQRTQRAFLGEAGVRCEAPGDPKEDRFCRAVCVQWRHTPKRPEGLRIRK